MPTATRLPTEPQERIATANGREPSPFVPPKGTVPIFVSAKMGLSPLPRLSGDATWLLTLHFVEDAADFIEFFFGGAARRERLEHQRHRRAIVDFFNEVVQHPLAGLRPG